MLSTQQQTEYLYDIFNKVYYVNIILYFIVYFISYFMYIILFYVYTCIIFYVHIILFYSYIIFYFMYIFYTQRVVWSFFHFPFFIVFVENHYQSLELTLKPKITYERVKRQLFSIQWYIYYRCIDKTNFLILLNR